MECSLLYGNMKKETDTKTFNVSSYYMILLPVPREIKKQSNFLSKLLFELRCLCGFLAYVCMYVCPKKNFLMVAHNKKC